MEMFCQIRDAILAPEACSPLSAPIPFSCFFGPFQGRTPSLSPLQKLRPHIASGVFPFLVFFWRSESRFFVPLWTTQSALLIFLPEVRREIVLNLRTLRRIFSSLSPEVPGPQVASPFDPKAILFEFATFLSPRF